MKKFTTAFIIGAVLSVTCLSSPFITVIHSMILIDGGGGPALAQTPSSPCTAISEYKKKIIEIEQEIKLCEMQMRGLRDYLGQQPACVGELPLLRASLEETKKYLKLATELCNEMDELSTLMIGARGDDVEAVQSRLIALGYDLGKCGADGIFGKKTLAAVNAFQLESGLKVDWLVRNNTWGELKKENAPPPTSSFIPFLRGHSQTYQSILQKQLAKAGKSDNPFQDWIKNSELKTESQSHSEEAKEIFGDKIDYSKVRIVTGEDMTLWGKILTRNVTAVAFCNTIYFPNDDKGESLYNPEGNPVWFIHEMTHIYQYQNYGWTYIPRAVWEQVTEKNPYKYELVPDKSFRQYDIEEQAEIVAHYSQGFLTPDEAEIAKKILQDEGLLK